MEFAALEDSWGSPAEDIPQRAATDCGCDSEEQCGEKGQPGIESAGCSGNGEESQRRGIHNQEKPRERRSRGQFGEKTDKATRESDQQIPYIEQRQGRAMLNQNVAGHPATKCRDHCQAEHTDKVELVIRMALGFKGAAERSGGDSREV